MYKINFKNESEKKVLEVIIYYVFFEFISFFVNYFIGL